MEPPSSNQPQQRETKQQATTTKSKQQAKQQSTCVDIGEAGKNRNGRLDHRKLTSRRHQQIIGSQQTTTTKESTIKQDNRPTIPANPIDSRGLAPKTEEKPVRKSRKEEEMY